MPFVQGFAIRMIAEDLGWHLLEAGEASGELPAQPGAEAHMVHWLKLAVKPDMVVEALYADNLCADEEGTEVTWRIAFREHFGSGRGSGSRPRPTGAGAARWAWLPNPRRPSRLATRVHPDGGGAGPAPPAFHPPFPLTVPLADEPARYGVWTTLEGGRNATGPEDVDRLLRRDNRSVFFTERPGAPALPADGRASEIAPGTQLRLSGFGRGATRWSATLTRTTDGFAVQPA